MGNIGALRRLEHHRNFGFLDAAAGLFAVRGTLLQSLTQIPLGFTFTFPIKFFIPEAHWASSS
ncbi:hypothetical protein [Flavobacterium caeni]|uniref:Uncharacterized protein n=1 Tax=Flavobacterium caeni TaxID=490189 RepID=A0A1G5AZ23_9FLAO|nr:hypothetical protein [Flavobacterium caeni]SCX83092.1 hypothetical protein SAMN02927903_00198 [Flavobacterium caeni]